MTSLGAIELLVAFIVFIVSSYFITTYNKKKQNLPPGPTGLPIVGYLPFLRKDTHVKLRDIAFKYGDVFSLYLGRQLVVVLNGADAIKEGLNKSEYMGRPHYTAFNFHPEIPSIVTISGKGYNEQRKFMLSSMRHIGSGKSVVEECIKDEIEHFVRVVEKWNGQPHELKTVLAPSMSNNITSLLFGRRYDYEDPRRNLIDSNRKIVIQFSGQTALHIFFPWIKYIPFISKFLGYDRALRSFDTLYQFYRDQIEEHRMNLDPNNTRDYIDKFLLEIQEAKEKKIAGTSFTENMLLGNAGAILGAGSETVQTTVDWCFYIMAVYPTVQRKVQQEIDSVVRPHTMPSYSDQKNMPYTQAVIMEIMRWKTIVPLNLLRYTSEDTIFRGYHIPRRTILLTNLWSAHYDPKYWEIPEIFKPERFLSPDGQRVIKPEGYMPFSAGRRSCPGEPMAVVEVFIYVTTILQRFNIRLGEGEVPDLNGILTVSYTPKPHRLCFISRSQND